MPEAVPLYGEMRVSEYLKFRAELKGVPGRERRARVEQAMAEARVDDLAETLIHKLSKGYKQRVGLADALVARPPILILDEPTAGLDPNQIREVRELIRGLGERHTILLSTHILPEVEATCSRAVVIAGARW
jgi:ABC-2 type transport system ATP-binding protein